MAYLNKFSCYLIYAILSELFSFILMRYFENFWTLFIAHLDNILIYNESILVYTQYIQKVLFKLYNAKLFFDIRKCDFLVKKVK